MSKKYKKSIFWFRRDLRLEDNAGLYKALKFSDEVIPVFIFDRQILSKLEDKEDPRVQFIHETISKMKSSLLEKGSDLHVYYGNPEEVWKEISKNVQPDAVFAIRDYEPYAKERDSSVARILAEEGADFLMLSLMSHRKCIDPLQLFAGSYRSLTANALAIVLLY